MTHNWHIGVISTGLLVTMHNLKLIKSSIKPSSVHFPCLVLCVRQINFLTLCPCLKYPLLLYNLYSDISDVYSSQVLWKAYEHSRKSLKEILKKWCAAWAVCGGATEVFLVSLQWHDQWSYQGWSRLKGNEIALIVWLLQAEWRVTLDLLYLHSPLVVCQVKWS